MPIIEKQLPPEKTALENLAKQMAPKMRAAFIKSIDRLKGSVSISALVEAIEAKGPEGIIDAIDWEEHERKQANDIRPVTAAIMALSVKRMARIFRGKIRRQTPAFKLVSIPFSGNTTSIQSFIQNETGRLIRNINTISRDAVKDVVSRAIARGETPREAAKYIKDNIMGLTPRQARATDNFKTRLLGQGVKGPRVKELTDRFSNRQLKLRANNIAQTEITQAANQAQMEVWDQAIDQGVLNRDTARKVWNTTPGTPDDDCDFANGQVRRLGEAFDLGEFGSFQSPPAHVACFTGGMEVLTKEGWKLFIDVTMKDLILSCDLKTIEYEWVGIEVMFWKYAETVSLYENDHIDLAVSQDHRHVITKSKSHVHSNYWNMSFQTDDKLSIKEDCLISSYQQLDHTNMDMLAPHIFNIPLSEIKVSKVSHQGRVWGMTLERNNTLFVRRNNKVTLTGNCLCDLSLITVEA